MTIEKPSTIALSYDISDIYSKEFLDDIRAVKDYLCYLGILFESLVFNDLSPFYDSLNEEEDENVSELLIKIVNRIIRNYPFILSSIDCQMNNKSMYNYFICNANIIIDRPSRDVILDIDVEVIYNEENING